MKKFKFQPTQDVWRFKSELRDDFETLKLLERHFFTLDDECETAIKFNPEVANMLDKQQEQAYDMMTSLVVNLCGKLRGGREVLYGRKEDGEV